MGKLISAMDLRKLAGESKQVVIPQGSVMTPSAHDIAKELGITVLWENTVSHALNVKKGEPLKQEGQDRNEAPVPQAPNSAEMGPEDIAVVVRKVISQVMKPACLNPKVTYVKGADVRLEAFGQAPPGQDIKIVDVITSREANLCAGFMEFNRSKFPWHLTYDEVDYVVEGTFELKVGNATYTCKAGDILYIPKDTHVVFGSPTQAKVFYVTYPANWAELQ